MAIKESKPDDYVLATGESHSVEKFLTLATEYAGLGNWQDYVEIDKSNMRPTDIEELIGDSSKARKQLGCKSKKSFKDLIRIMVKHDIESFKLKMDPLSF